MPATPAPAKPAATDKPKPTPKPKPVVEKPPREPVSNVVADLETLIIEIGADGDAIERGCELAVAEQIFVVIDPRAGRTIGEVACLNDADMLRKIMMGGGGKTTLKIFLLLPSSTSSKAHLMNAHMAIYFLGHWLEQQQEGVRFIRADDYFHNGDEIMKAMVAEDKVVYPAEETESMMKMIMAVTTCLWPKRAYVHWPIGLGLEEGTVCPEVVIGTMAPLLTDEGKALARIGDAPPGDGVAAQAVCASVSRPAFLAFSEDSAGNFQEKCGESDFFTVTEDILGLIEADELADELGGLAAEWQYPVCLVGANDLAEYGNLFTRFLNKWRETKPCMSLCVVLVDESVDNFKANLWLVPALHQLIENADMVVFATNDEVGDACSFFTKTKFPEADVAKTAMFQLIPFPRIHFYTMGTALGAELEDGEIWLPAVTVGPAAGAENLPGKEKFKTEKSPFIFPDFPAENHELVIPGQEEFAGATLIHPAKLLASIFSGVTEALQATTGEEGSSTWAVAFGEGFAGSDKEPDDMELTEAESNVNDLMSEITQYLDCSLAEEEEECDEE